MTEYSVAWEPIAMAVGLAAIPIVGGLVYLACSWFSDGQTSGGGSSKMHSSNPGPEVKIDAKFEPLREAKRTEWRAKGYPEGMIEKALVWAEEYTIGMATRITTDPALRYRIEQELYPKSLEMSEKWIKGFVEFLK